MTVLEVSLPFEPRPYQINVIKALNDGIKRVCICWHRRSGKDLTIFNWCVYKLLQEPAVCFYIFPTYAQGKKVIWDSITIDGRRYLDFIPHELIENKNKQELKINFINGSALQIVGSDKIDSIVGTNPKIIVFSEYAIQSPQAWDYLSPILRINKGIAIFVSTPRGKNHFFDMFNHACNDSAWFAQKLGITDTGVLQDSDLDEERRAGMSEEFIQQEYYCSFSRGVQGSYYGTIIEKMRQENRICNVPYDTRSPVHTAFDIGYGDSTSITFWQEIGGELRIIDFYESHGEGIVHYAKVLQGKPYVYGTHYMPHDAGSGSIQTGRTLQDVAYEVGIKTTILEREKDLSIGIDAVRSMLSVAFIDQTKCAYLIKCLENYHKIFNEKQNCYSESPQHDWTSHAADSVRYMANARIQYGRGPGSMTPQKLQEIKNRVGVSSPGQRLSSQADLPPQFRGNYHFGR